MPGVFISYRREDSSGYAGRLFDIISAHFGRSNTFMDLDTIEGGDDFSKVIGDKIGASDVLLAVIGPHWVTASEAGGTRRLDNPRDFVRLEVGKALQRGIRVIPVLVGGASLPRPEDLPEDLRPLCDRQAMEIRDAHFHPDSEQLIAVLHQTLHGFRYAEPSAKRFLPAILAAIAILSLGGYFLSHRMASVATQSGKGAANSTAHPANVNGAWKATVKYDWGDSYDETFIFNLDGGELSGTASFLGSSPGHERGLYDGKVEGNRLSFMTKSLVSISSDDKTYEDKHYYKGIVEGSSIRFTMITDSSVESHVPIHFVAYRIGTK